MISVVGVTHASDGQSTDTAKKSKFSKVGVTKGPYPVPTPIWGGGGHKFTPVVYAKGPVWGG